MIKNSPRLSWIVNWMVGPCSIYFPYKALTESLGESEFGVEPVFSDGMPEEDMIKNSQV